MKDTFERLAYDCDADFSRLLNAYLNYDELDFDRKIREHFKLVNSGNPLYLNHSDVLALSVGGSTTKLMIASNENGFINIKHLVVVRNPMKPINYYDFLDSLIYNDKVVHEYITTYMNPSMCLTLPVMIGEDNIPFHPLKIANIYGMLARNEANKTENLKVDKNLNLYFKSRNIKSPKIYFQSDPVIAHIGGFSQIKLNSDERSILLVCGTGMATADDNYQRVIGRLPVLNFDEGLFPNNPTEGYIYSSGCCGKGLYELMARVINIRANENLLLKNFDINKYFFSLYDSINVSRLWKSTIDGTLEDSWIQEIQACISSEMFFELQRIACSIMDRLIGNLANAILVTAIKINQREIPSKYYILFEGSIALDKNINKRIKQCIIEQLEKDELFYACNVNKPEIILEERKYKKIIIYNNIDKEIIDKIDITLIGTAVAAMANDVLTTQI